jgi:hypothetical protein
VDRLVIACGLLVSMSVPAIGGAEIVLSDGTRVAGRSVERRQGEVHVVLDSGERIVMPAELVREIVLTDSSSSSSDETVAPTAEAKPGPDPAAEALPEGVATFRPDVSTLDWTPVSDWRSDLDRLDADRASQWSLSPLDVGWKPTQRYHEADDSLRFDFSRWSRSPVRSSWKPADGYVDDKP